VRERGAWDLTGDAHITQLRFLLEQFAIAPQRRLAEIVLPTESIPRPAADPELAAASSFSFATFLQDEEEPKQEHAMFAQMSPEIPLSLPQEEEEQGWVDWLKGDPCVHELFEARVTETPDATAVQLQGQTLTYRELNARANQLAHYLRKLNVLPSIAVGLCFTPSVEGIVALLGVLKAGGAYLPLAPTLEEHELQEIVTESAISVLLTQARLEPKFRTVPLHCIVLCLDSDWALIAEEAADNLGCLISDEHPACFLIAAETPAVITHAQLAQTVGTAQEWFRFATSDPWHLFGVLPIEPAPEPASAPAAEPMAELVSEPALEEDEALSELNRGMDWFDLQPELALATARQLETPPNDNPDFVSDLTPEAVPDETPIFTLELDEAVETTTETMATEEFELDLSLPAEAALSRAETNSDVAEEIAFGSSTLAPIQQWFFAQQPAVPQHWNVSLLVEIEEQLEATTLQQALRLVIAQHDALRWRFVETQTGWQLQTDAEATTLPFEYVDFSTKWARSQRKAIEETADNLQTSLHLSEGPLWRAAYFDLGPGRAHRLLIIAHQLITDEASLRLFLHDWLTTYEQLHHEQEAALPPQTLSYEDWWHTLLAAQSAETEAEEQTYWQQLQTRPPQDLPIDHPDQSNTYGQVDRVFVSLNSKETERLLEYVPAAADADVNEVVLTALILALARWTGTDGAWLEVEREARKLPMVDVTHTMGWFAMKFPVWLEVSAPADQEAALQAVQTQLRAVPQGGLSYGLRRYNGVAATTLCDIPQPQVSFKYLAFPAEETTWHVAPESVGLEHHPHNARHVLLAVTGAMNLNMLEFRWDYAKAQFEQKTIGVLVNSFIEELRRLIHHYVP
jgi:non-ribosomal peptide synthase protein (TIGR01720 family)